MGEGQKQQVHIITALMPLEWHMIKNNGEPDIESANRLLESVRNTKAQQLFRRTLAILKHKSMVDTWAKEYGKPTPDLTKNPPHEDLMQYSEGALYFLDIMTPYDYTEMSAIMDEKGIFQGARVHPKEQDDITEGALQP